MCVRKGIKCPFYEEHNGVYFQGCYEHTDLCYLGQDVEALSVYCTFDGYGCWFYTENPVNILKKINEAFKAEYKRTVWNRKEHKWEWEVYQGVNGLQRANLKRDLDLIFETLNELDKDIDVSFYN